VSKLNRGFVNKQLLKTIDCYGFDHGSGCGIGRSTKRNTDVSRLGFATF